MTLTKTLLPLVDVRNHPFVVVAADRSLGRSRIRWQP